MTSSELLIQHQIHPTANRLLVLNALLHSTSPRSMSELEDELQTIDKSNIFRTLTLFHEHRLAHQITDANGVMRYEVCHSHDHDCDTDRHAHFICRDCGRIVCLHDAEPISICLPDGYIASEVNCIIQGLCPDCSKKTSTL
ncbi:MAG: transcriptional repressor [Paludibacteraceae bacterium]|nr:transcriptional repressor [Paludibacteraceae bacterium]